MNPSLEKLLSTQFDDAVGVILPTRALRLQLQPLVKEVEKAIRWKEIDEPQFREFVGQLAESAIASEPKPADLALAALAVAVERIPFEFTEEFLCDLASLRLPQLSISARMARECLTEYYQLPSNEFRAFRFASEVQVKHSNRWRASSQIPIPRHLSIQSIPFRKPSEAR
jgi:hypothetical protein